MPTYEYNCTACGHELEVFQSMKDDPLRKCPACKKMKLQRLIGLGAGLLFKGSGFYETDYKAKTEAGKDKDTAKDSEKKKSDSGGDGKADSTKSTKKSEAPAAKTTSVDS